MPRPKHDPTPNVEKLRAHIGALGGSTTENNETLACKIGISLYFLKAALAQGVRDKILCTRLHTYSWKGIITRSRTVHVHQLSARPPPAKPSLVPGFGRPAYDCQVCGERI